MLIVDYTWTLKPRYRGNDNFNVTHLIKDVVINLKLFLCRDILQVVIINQNCTYFRSILFIYLLLIVILCECLIH